MVGAVVMMVVAKGKVVIELETVFIPLYIHTCFYSCFYPHSYHPFLPFRGQFIFLNDHIFLFYSVVNWFYRDMALMFYRWSFSPFRIHDSRPLGQGHSPSYSRNR